MDEDALIGTVLAERYRVDGLIGAGAMGKVYRAEHIHMRKPVALKILHAQLTRIPDMVQRFEQEAQAAAKIQHPHVAAATDFGKLPDGSVYLALEYIEGASLSRLIHDGPIAVRRALDIACQVSSALEEAHGHGIVHRDLKPDNLLLVDFEGGDYIKVLDFGIAKISTPAEESDKPLTLAGVVYGTPEYMAPEQALAQEVDGRADLYSLGVILFEMLTGRRPYLGPIAGLLGQQLSQPLPRMAELAQVRVPFEVEQLVTQLLSTEPKRRPSTATEVRDQLESLLLAWDEGRLSRAASSAELSLRGRSEPPSRHDSSPSPPAQSKPAVKSRTGRTTFVTILFLALGAGGVILAVGALSDSQATIRSTQLATPPPPVAEESKEPPELGSRLDQAREKGLEALRSLAREFPAEGMIQAELALEYAKAEKFEESLEAARSALALDPQLNEHPKVAGALFRSTQAPAVRAAGFRLLRGAMGAAGVSIIYDLAATSAVSARVRAEARILLDKDDVQQSASPAVRLLLALEKARSCEQFEPLVQQATLVGDKRALSFLEKLTETTGCGPKKQGDCYACLRDSSALSEAISKLKQRATLGESSSIDTPVSEHE